MTGGQTVRRFMMGEAYLRRGGIALEIRRYTVQDFLGRPTDGIVCEKIQTILDDMKNKGILYMEGRECITGYDG